MRKRIFILLLGLPALIQAQNPVIRDQFSADPTARVFNNKVYLFPSHDIKAPAGQRQDWFCMEDYHVFSSENLTEWIDHGMIISQKDVPWGNPTGYAMWAPDCVQKNGKYYFYFPNAPKNGRGFGIGVATADVPEGPYRLEPKPIEGVSGIDPCVLLDDDGSAYIYWGGGGLRGAKLKANMLELEGPLQEIPARRRPGAPENTPQMPPTKVGGQNMEGLPDGFKEGPFAFKRNGWYYLTFPWVRSNDKDKADKENPHQGVTETLAYAMSKNPLGPWDFKGLIMAEHPNGCWTNHHSLVEYKGQWYIFYHTNFFSPAMDKRRSTCIEKVNFNADGTIQQVKETMRGVGINKATEKIQIDRFSAASAGVTTENIDTTIAFRGASATLPRKGSWLRYNDVDFSMLKDAYLIVCASAKSNTEFAIREKNATGKILAKVALTVKTDNGRFRRDMSGQWITLTAPLAYLPKGVTDIVVTCEGEPVSVDWVQFKNRPLYLSPTSGTVAQPDGKGFIRRWMLLEPIKQDIRSNIVFTNTYLNEAFNKSYFKGQMTVLPKDGQKVKVEKQSLKWHAFDSNFFNVKLFRFAEKYGDQTYGSLYWAATVIDCPEEIKNVRLAAGSNGASCWWLNGEQVLLLEGDRRMVEDDGMSGRITLKKGRNILRTAVINGPGLADMCVRFLDEKGNPVTNYSITLK
jgi:hypothetical protein